MRYLRNGLLLLMVLCAGLWPRPVQAVPSPTEQVRTTVDRVIEVLKDDALSDEARHQKLSSLIRARFDFTIMSQRTLGGYWKTATAHEQERFVDLFSDLLEASYLGRIESYSNEVISYRGERQIEGRAEVATSVRSGNDEIPIDYRLVLEDGEWFVYDVIIEDVSLIKNYRSSYGEIVRNEGFEGLFSRMEQKIKELRAAPPAEAAGAPGTS